VTSISGKFALSPEGNNKTKRRMRQGLVTHFCNASTQEETGAGAWAT
jgi:hypothetical protein